MILSFINSFKYQSLILCTEPSISIEKVIIRFHPYLRFYEYITDFTIS